MKKINFDKKRTIELKDGNNKGLIIGFCACILLLVFFCTSKLWLPDDRANMNFTKNQEYNFAMATVKLPSFVNYDENKNLIEFEINESQFSSDKKFDVKYSAFTDTGVKLPSQTIKEDKTNTDKLTVTKQRKLIQVRVLEDFYYVKVVIEQKDGVQEEFYIDYRNVKKTKISEKGKEYLNNENAEKELKTQESN